MKANSLIFNTDLHRFDEDVIEVSWQHPVLVDFWADWCSPCIAIAPVLSRVVEDFAGAVTLAKLEVDEGDNMKLAGRYLVRGFPTIVLIREGAELDRFSGAKPAQFIKAFIDAGLKSTPN